jgi:hypothetical protein
MSVAALANGGPDAAGSVSMVDTLPATMTFVLATPSQGTCSGTSTVTCSLGTIASGASATVTIVAQTTNNGPATNTATVSSNSSDTNPGQQHGHCEFHSRRANPDPLAALSRPPRGAPGGPSPSAS